MRASLEGQVARIERTNIVITSGVCSGVGDDGSRVDCGGCSELERSKG